MPTHMQPKARFVSSTEQNVADVVERIGAHCKTKRHQTTAAGKGNTMVL